MIFYHLLENELDKYLKYFYYDILKIFNIVDMKKCGQHEKSWS